jgi:hypothetical protein
MHPLCLFFLKDFCRRNDWNVDWLLDCMSEDGNEWMPESTALEIEELSSGEVPLSSWPRVLPERRLSAGLIPGQEPPMSPRAAAAARTRDVPKPREGRPPKNPDFPLYRWFAKKKTNSDAFGKAESISHQRISYWVNGRSPIPRELADRWERVTAGEVPWTCWPLVVQRGGSGEPTRWWSLGRPVAEHDLPDLRLKLVEN